jgi:hypothetical protein
MHWSIVLIACPLLVLAPRWMDDRLPKTDWHD